MDPQKIIQQSLAGYLKPGKTYPGTIPPGFAPWYCYTVDGGHSLLCLPKVFEGKTPITDYLVPLPVRFVVERGTVRPDGVIVVDVLYDSTLGAMVPDGYDEY